MAVGGTFAKVFGTSASTPTAASLFALINGQRLNAGKSSIGYILPVLYLSPEVFNDVTEGNNRGCGSG